ncbi:MAG: hypothetical protein PGN13_14665 [Patulibacter minatonensis]
MSSTIALVQSTSASRVGRVQRALAGVRAHVDDLHRWHPAAVDALLHADDLERGVALGAWRGAPAEQDGAVVLRSPGRDAPGVVPRVAFVLVGAVVLLVDDHEPEIVERCEDGRARADDDPRLAAADPPPLVAARPLAEAGVQHGDDIAEALLEAVHDLRGESDLGHEHEHGAAGLERRARGAQVHLGLAAAGHAVQQERPAPALARALDPRQCGELLLGGRRLLRRARTDGVARRAPSLVGRLDHDEPAPLERAQPREVVAGGARAAQREALEQLALRRRELGVLIGFRLREARPEALARLAVRRLDELQRAGRRGGDVVGHPPCHRHELHGGAALLDRLDRLQLLGRHVRLFGARDDDPADRSVRQRDPHHRADRRAALVEVVQLAGQPARRHERHDLGDGRHPPQSGGSAMHPFSLRIR